jgi:hypothetical protein
MAQTPRKRDTGCGLYLGLFGIAVVILALMALGALGNDFLYS